MFANRQDKTHSADGAGLHLQGLRKQVRGDLPEAGRAVAVSFNE